MSKKTMEGFLMKPRVCQRFSVPGATLSYRLHRFLRPDKDFVEVCPVLDLAKGGVGFLTNTWLRPRQKLLLFLTFAAGEAPIQLKAKVVYCIQSIETSRRNHVGVAFMPFAPGRRHNSREALQALDRLEKIHLGEFLDIA
jgi:hypothetical protein